MLRVLCILLGVAFLLPGAQGVWGQVQVNDATLASIQAYFDLHNDPIADTPHVANTPRRFSWVKKINAFDRDGWKCVACGAAEELELDHAVALMNGGSNELDNLYALCHTCHVVKTRMDRGLKRHRVKLAKQLADASADGGRQP